MIASLDIRRAVPSDAPRLAELARRTFAAAFADDSTPSNIAAYLRDAFSDEQIRAELADTRSTFIWAEQTGIPAGYAKLRRGSALDCVSSIEPVQLERMYAETDQIGVGIGKTLLHTAIKIAQSEGFKTLWLGVWQDNRRALEFYRRQGFREVGTRDFMLGHDRQTDIVMELDLRR